MCSFFILLSSAKSAIVLATFNILPYALALKPSFSKDKLSILFPASSNLQYFSISFGVSWEFEYIFSSLYLFCCIFLALSTLVFISFDVSIFSLLSNLLYFTGVTSIWISILSSKGPAYFSHIFCYHLFCAIAFFIFRTIISTWTWIHRCYKHKITWIC